MEYELRCQLRCAHKLGLLSLGGFQFTYISMIRSCRLTTMKSGTDACFAILQSLAVAWNSGAFYGIEICACQSLRRINSSKKEMQEQKKDGKMSRK